MELYPQSRAPEPDRSLFARPSAEYRGAPFWSWNGTLDRARLLRQLDELAAMGMGGAHLHSRTGLATPYLGEEFRQHVRAVVERCAERGLLAWLYDEDRWPSGAAGGLVTRDETHRLRYLLFTPRSYAEDPGRMPGPSTRVESFRTGRGRLLARYALCFESSRLTSACPLADGEPPGPGAEAWYAYLEACPPSTWYNDQGPANVLSPAAIRRFIESTHETYRATVGDAFGTTVPAIFTDEPLFTGKGCPASWNDRRDVHLPWTDDLHETLRSAHGFDILPVLPALFFDGLPDTARIRWCWHDHVAERFRTAFAEPIAGWCARNGLIMTGHLESEDSLSAQTSRAGECMRFYQPMQLPGVDMLCDAMELSTVLQARSVARQEGRAGVLSELYGVTNWDFDFTGHKRQGDWQAALGVTVRVHHMAWFSMAGEAKRDYPAAIDAHSPWFREYPLIEDHFARLNTCLTRGRPLARVAVVHPIESLWPYWGQSDTNGAARQALENRFQQLTRYLLEAQIDFDFIAESLLPRQNVGTESSCLRVGAMEYDAVLLPGLHTIRATTLHILEHFRAAGGRIAFLGHAPALVDARPSDAAEGLAARCARLEFEPATILSWLADLREVAVGAGPGKAVGILHQLRADGPNRWLFACETRRTDAAGPVTLALRGAWRAEVWDTRTGSVREAPVRHTDGWSHVAWDATPAGHILLRWMPDAVPAAPSVLLPPAPAWREIGRLPDPVGVTCDEPNVLLLDRAEGRLDDGDWEPDCEVLRLDNAWRVRLGWGRITSRIAQPWAAPPLPPDHVVTLRYTLRLDVPIAAPRLALERAHEAGIRLDGHDLRPATEGHFVDEDIPTLPLPPLAPGTHVLEVRLPYGPTRTLEWAYLLGGFGVRLQGRRAVVTAQPEAWTWGDLAVQGLPFYGGNLAYDVRLVHAGGPLALQFHRFQAPLLRVTINGADAGPVAFPPYRLDLGDRPAGLYACMIACFGNRWPSFGQWHHAHPERRHWWGPDSWRTEGEDWSEEYVPRPFGILSAPILLTRT